MRPDDRPKRFYKVASSEAVAGGWCIQLDARPIRTPARATLTVPTAALAQAIEQEWARQGERLDLATMALTRLANVAIDRAPASRAELAEELARYAGTDVTCYLAEGSGPLRARQQAAWTPHRVWAGEAMGVVLVPVEGIVAMPQPQASLDAVRRHALGLDDFRLTGLVWTAGLLGSAVLALAVEQGALDARDAFAASVADEDWQAERWGRDEEADIIRARREADAAAAGVWFRALSA